MWTFWARTDSNSANNPALNLTGDPAVQITFVEAGPTGNLTLETNSGLPDPNTQVEIGGVPYDFTFELSAELPTLNKNGAGQVPDQFEGSPIFIVTVQDYPSAGETTRLAFMPNETASQAEMDAFGNGAIALQNTGTEPASDYVVEGTAGDDVIDASYEGDLEGDKIDNNDGNPLQPGSAGADNDYVTAGDGNDYVAAGTGDDTLFGEAGNDSLLGQDGNDIIYGGIGDDTVNGGTGDDSILGEDGNDSIAGGSGNDVIDGGDGADLIRAGFGEDTVYGGSGNDSVFGGADNDLIDGGAGDDTVDGRAGDDIFYGGAGNDFLIGGEGADSLFGGDGADTITFSEGDSAAGGANDDLFILEDLGEPTNGTITIDGGTEDGADTLQLGTLGILTQAVKDSFVDDGSGSFSGTITLDDGTILNFSEIENIICFTPGTRIATPRGQRPIEDLKVGDMVVTRDHGLQPIRWIQSRKVPAIDRFAPIRIRPGVVTGLETDVLVSPQHRMLFQGYEAELLFGESEVLVAATHLVDGMAVTRETGGTVTYIHMMFDQHEIVYAEGAASESFHPGEIGLSAVSDPAREELFALFPALRSDPGHYGRTARKCLKKHEAQLIRF